MHIKITEIELPDETLAVRTNDNRISGYIPFLDTCVGGKITFGPTNNLELTFRKVPLIAPERHRLESLLADISSRIAEEMRLE